MSMILSYRRGPICLLLLSMSSPACVPVPVDKGAPADTKESGHSIGPEDSRDSTSGDSAESGTDSGAESGDTGGCPESAWYPDADHDGFGDPDAEISACEQPEGTVTNAEDCDDTRADVYPGAVEVCDDGAYNDCDDEHGELAWESCVGEDTFALTEADARILGEDEGDVAGAWIDAPGDVDGDGRDDLLIGAPFHESGRVYLVKGPVSGLIDLSTADATLRGEGTDLPAQGDVSGGGDVNADGYVDFVVGAPYSGPDGAYVVYGPISGTMDLTDADALWAGVDMGWYIDTGQAGLSVASRGDLDADGWDDVVIGAPGADTDFEESELGSCPTEAVDEGTEGGYEAGAAYVILGPGSGTHLLSDAEVVFYGEDGADYAGYSVASEGDMDGDGVDDLIVGAPMNCEAGSRAGAAYLLYGPLSGIHDLEDADGKALATKPDDGAGMEVNRAGDLDGDGTPEILMGASNPHWSEGRDGRGAVYVLDGPLEGKRSIGDARAVLVGVSVGDHLGEAASAAGDVDGDGFADLILGAYGDDEGGDYAGAAWLIFGPIEGEHPLSVGVKLVGGAADDETGVQAMGVGDTNGDGAFDLLVGATGDDEGGSNAGAVYVVLGGGTILSSLGSW